jgi:glycosyltransferase involved in cell wall biosynthesis
MIMLGTDARKALGKEARNRAIESFSLEKIVTQYEDLYEDVSAKKLA